MSYDKILSFLLNRKNLLSLKMILEDCRIWRHKIQRRYTIILNMRIYDFIRLDV